MSKVLFVSEKTIKENTILEENLDSKIVRITTYEVQDLELSPIIGAKKYKEIEDAIVAKHNDPLYVIPQDIVDLLEVCTPFILYGVLTGIQVAMTYKATNKGFTVKDDTAAVTIAAPEYESVKRYYRGKYDAYRKRLLDYVKECYNIGTDDTPYSVGWYLPDRPNYAEYYELKSNKLIK